MIKIKKITDKEEIKIAYQSSSCICGSNGKPVNYTYKDRDCMIDCAKKNQPSYYQSSCS
ncbi:hypothetical protein NSA24_07515 [Clostridioides mangenotii]|uniref:hypothetical protein n=1 Tax=Metaclostridioides mangenotii TaxID=1540 RepID=UPI00214A4B53|nr:hypothetical protein [Clostridioides mangenotii]MCR1954639.1 hypothetical protein [Clostridioides mangenotii]